VDVCMAEASFQVCHVLCGMCVWFCSTWHVCCAAVRGVQMAWLYVSCVLFDSAWHVCCLAVIGLRMVLQHVACVLFGSYWHAAC